MRAHVYPSVLLKNTRDNDTTEEGPLGQSLATCGGSGVSPTFRPSEWSKPWSQGLLLHSDLANGQNHGLGGFSRILT
jgi:hypothetical protein